MVFLNSAPSFSPNQRVSDFKRASIVPSSYIDEQVLLIAILSCGNRISVVQGQVVSLIIEKWRDV